MIAASRITQDLIPPFYACDGRRNQAADAPLPKERQPPSLFAGVSPYPAGHLPLDVPRLHGDLIRSSWLFLHRDRNAILAAQASELVCQAIQA